MSFLEQDFWKWDNRKFYERKEIVEKVKDVNGLLVCVKKGDVDHLKKYYDVDAILLKDIMSGNLAGDNTPTYYLPECIVELERMLNEEIDKNKGKIKRQGSIIKKLRYPNGETEYLKELYGTKAPGEANEKQD